MIQGHGNDIYKYGDRVKIDFSSNIAFNNHSHRVIEHIKTILPTIENYPDPSARVLSEKIAAHHGVSPQEVMVCNGSAESFYLAAHYASHQVIDFRPRSLILTPSFAEYEDSCSVYRHHLYFSSLLDFYKINFSIYHSVWIGTPNNPDGYRIPISNIIEAAQEDSDTLFIVDRAYNDLSASCDDIAQSPPIKNVILIHSMTKSFGIPGLRLGYIVADKDVIASMMELRPPWSVNAISLAAGEFIMDNYNSLRPDIEELLQLSGELQESLSQIDYLEVTPSDANFFLCEIIDGRTAEELHSYLINEHSILIRNASNFKFLTPHHFRVATQSRDENSKLIEALKVWR